MLTVLLGSGADFSNSGARASTSAQRAPCLCILDEWFEL